MKKKETAENRNNVISLFPNRKDQKEFECQECRGTGQLVKVHGRNAYAYRCPCPSGVKAASFPLWIEPLKVAK